ncbi:MAG TPA: energy transducer TonB [Candidatus Sulfotelmatobacter sp.]|jgi:hypothetical protein|nr:energy transducer TonB [Candidatus Sulfotelmatobacter sp.]
MPDYRRLDDMKVRRGLVRITIRPNDFTLKNLVCLAQTLKQRYPDWENINVLIFTSRDAAKHFAAGPRVELSAAADKAQRELHAMYEFNRNETVDQLSILPLGYRTDSSDATVIKLPLVGDLHCRYEVRTRCLIGTDNLQYPYESLKAGATGKITFTGTIARDGRIVALQASGATVSPSAEKTVLQDAARRNLSSWRFEPSNVEDPIRITFEYMTDRLLGHNLTDISFQLPNQVTIKGNP